VLKKNFSNFTFALTVFFFDLKFLQHTFEFSAKSAVEDVKIMQQSERKK